MNNTGSINSSKLYTSRKSIVNKKTKTITQFRPMILSRHPSHNCLRANTKNIVPLPYRAVVRFGSTTEVDDTIANGGNRIEINTVESIKNSANKLLMKQKFQQVAVKTAEWIKFTNLETLKKLVLEAEAHYSDAVEKLYKDAN